MTIIAGEKGKTLRINVGYDLSTAQTIELIIDGPGNLTLKTVNPTVGNVDVKEDGKTLLANNYIEYKLASKDDNTEIPVKGYYVLKVKVVFNNGDELMSLDKTIHVEQ